MRDPDSGAHVPIGERRHARHVDLPLDARLKTRIGRAVINALAHPARTPTLRQSVHRVAAELRAMGLNDAEIERQLAALVESIALGEGHNAVSVVSGRPRWLELSDRVAEWVRIDTPSGDSRSTTP